MIARFGDLAQNTQMSRLLMGAQTRSRTLQIQLGSSKAVGSFREVGSDTKRLLDAKAMLQRTRQFERDNNLIQGRLHMMESTIGSLTEVGDRLRVLLVQRLNDSSSQTGQTAIEAELLLQQVVGALNVKLEGRHLFAGSATDRLPVELDPAFAAFGSPDDTYYRGDGVELAVRADDGLQITYGMTADREGFGELIGALRAAIQGDVGNDRNLLEQALGLVNDALPKLADYRGEVGARAAQIEQINHVHGLTEVYLQERISDIEDVDIAEAVTRLMQDQLALEAAMATIARLSKLSLVEYIR
jgi:flagellar hook-associated protein 3 FlgL